MLLKIQKHYSINSLAYLLADFVEQKINQIVIHFFAYIKCDL